VATDKKKSLVAAAVAMRRRAEDLLLPISGETAVISMHEAQKLVHELEVHQLELEMQNEELCRSMAELELTRNRFCELYEFAPVSYLTFDGNGVIRELNLTAAKFLGLERSLLIHLPFANFIAAAGDREIFTNHLTAALRTKELQKCEIGITAMDGTVIHGLFQSIASEGNDRSDGYILTSIVDETARNQLNMLLQTANDELETIVHERTFELTRTNMQLTEEIAERKRTEASLKESYEEIKRLKEKLQAENIYLQQEVDGQFNFGEIVGQSPLLSNVFLLVDQVASMNATVLLLGETGTGKGVIARAIHGRSDRKNRPLITVNCTTLPATLIESELFGREKGAFTGSDARQIGRFELADGGTIFLDEIGELPLELQCKLLRVIQDGEFERLGSPRTIKCDVRIIAATNRNLKEEVKSGKFREDLYYRLNVFPITMPALRARREDIPLLVKHFIAKFNKKIGRRIDTVASDTLAALQDYHWPGNVRELENVIERAVIISQGSTLTVPDQFDTHHKSEEASGSEVKALGELEHDHIAKVLQQTGWRIEGKSGAAVILGINASTLRARMRKLGIVRQ